MQGLKTNSYISIYTVTTILTYIILNQGGYFAGGIISTGLITALLLMRTKISFKAVDLIFSAFALWYLFCSLLPGFDIRYTAKGLLPLLCLSFRFLLPDDTEKSKELLEKVIKISVYITIIAITVCLYSCITSMRLRRLIFPFQYANTSGIFFGIMFILSKYSKSEWAKKRQYIFFAGLILTQSVGAIGLTVLAEIFLSENKKKTLAMLIFLFVGAIILKDRIYQSIGTFIERFLQMRDGLWCMIDNPLFGIGAGRWELTKNLYQSGFYSAREIHSSIVQIGTDSGIVGFGLFIAVLIFAFKSIRFSNKAYLAGILMILGHSCLDFSLCFTALGFLLVLLFACGESNNKVIFEVKLIPKAIASVLLSVGFFTLSIGMYQIKKLDGIDLTKRYSLYVNYYESHMLSQKSVGTTENYAKALYATGNKEKCLTVLENIDVLSTDMIVLKQGCCGDWREALNYVNTQPYNSVLYKTVFYKSDDETLQKESEKMLNEAINSMSFLGKILFNFKGEKIL